MRSPGDNFAWERFVGSQKRLLASIVYRTAQRFGIHSMDEIDDALQEVCVKISSLAHLGKIPDGDDGFLETYGRTLVANAAHDHFRGQRAKKRDVLAAIPLDLETSGGPTVSNDLDAQVLLRELHGLAGGDARSRQVFQLYYRCGWTAKEIAALPVLGLSAKGVESLIYRITSDLRQKIQTGTPDMPSGKESPPHSS